MRTKPMSCVPLICDPNRSFYWGGHWLVSEPLAQASCRAHVRIKSTGEPGESRGMDQHQPASLLGKQPHWGESACHHPCCEGEHVLIALTDMQIQVTWRMSFHHADTPHPCVESWADMCSWIHFWFFLGFIHLRVRLWGRVDKWARDNTDQSMLRTGRHWIAHESEKTDAPSLLSSS